MAYRWTTDPADLELAEASRDFPDQASAEAWFSESWAEWAEAGVTAVTLWEGDRVVYGPMSLAEA